MATADYGLVTTGAALGFGIIGAGEQRCFADDPLGQTIIVYQMSARAGKPSSGSPTPTGRMFLLDLSGGAPDDALGYTNTVSPSAVMDNGAGGAVVTASMTTPLLLTSGPGYGLGLTSPSNQMCHGMTPAANLPDADNTWFYERANGSSIPIDQNGTGGSNQGHMSVWATGEINVAPNTPTSLAPSGTLASTDLTPQMQSNFSDDNETLPNAQTYDYLNQFTIEVQRVSDSASFWNFTDFATSTERTNRQVDRAYAGTTLVAGVSYRHRHRHSDRNGSWSAWSSWVTFTVNAGGTVISTAGTPTGKQNAVNPGPFVAQWQHPNPLNAKAAIVQIDDAAGNPYRTMTAFTLGAQVASGNNISVTFAQTGFANLPRGFSGKWKMMGQDTGNAWSPFSASKTFSVNATPNVPTALTPSGSQVFTSLPKIKCSVTDADDAGTALTVTAEIKRADTSTTTVTMVRNATTGLFEFQLTTTQVPTVQTVQWRAKASDGTSESVYSAYVTFIWGTGPVVTITSPADEGTITTSGNTITWTVPSGGPQAKKEVEIYELVNGVRVLPAVVDTGEITDAVNSYTVPDNTYRTGKRYELVVTVTNASPLSGTSAPVQFNATFTPPEAIAGLTATPNGLRAATGTTGIILSWPITLRAAENFVGYDLYRRALGPAQGGSEIAAETEISAGQVFLRRITSPVQTSFIDGNIVSGVIYEYELRQVIRVGLDSLVSDVVTTTGYVLLDHVMLTAARYPDAYGVELRHKSGTGGFLKSKLSLDKKKVVPVGGKKGRTIRSPLLAWDDSGTFELITDQHKTADQRLRDFIELVELEETCCLRDHLGLRRFVSIDSAEIERFGASRYVVTLSFSEESFIEGEALATAA